MTSHFVPRSCQAPKEMFWLVRSVERPSKRWSDPIEGSDIFSDSTSTKTNFSSNSYIFCFSFFTDNRSLSLLWKRVQRHENLLDDLYDDLQLGWHRSQWERAGRSIDGRWSAFFCGCSRRNTFALQKCVCWKLSGLLSLLLDLFSLQN